MAELTRSRTPSSGKVENEPSEKEFLVRIQRKNDSSLEEKANLKLKTRPLRSGNGLQIFLTRQDDPAFYYSVDITNMGSDQTSALFCLLKIPRRRSNF